MDNFCSYNYLSAHYLLGRFLSDPICEICETARKIAQFDFSAFCQITFKDKFGELADYLRKMSEICSISLQN